MAPAVPNQKRKRGGPVGSPIAANNASQRATRGRKTDKGSETADQHTGETMTESPENQKSGNRGRPRKGGSTTTEPAAEATSDRVRRSKRDRRSTDDNPWWINGSGVVEEQQEEASESSAPAKKRARTSRGPIATSPKNQGIRLGVTGKAPPRTLPTKPQPRTKMQTAPAEEPSEGAEQQPKRRGHARKSDDSGGAEEDAAAQKEFQPNQRARKRRSDVSLVSEESSAKDKSQPKESGRPSLPNVSVAGVTPSRESKANSSSTVAKRTTKAAAGKHGAAEAAQSAAERRRSKGSRRQEHDQLVAEMDDDLEASLPPVPKYQHIEQRTRHIPKSTISAKWQPLDDSSVKAITTLISDTSRPVLLRLRDTELRRQQGQNILRIFSNRLRSKLHKGMPFPPPTSKGAGVKSNKADLASGHVEELNFETTVDSIESMETMLDPLLHSVALLEKEKAKEEAALEREYETLRTLEANAKSEARGWKERMKKAHALAPEVRRHDDVLGVDGAAGEGLALVKHKSLSLNGVFNDTGDEGLLSVSKDIAKHMESIQRNLQPIQEVLPAMGKSRAALQSVLQRHLAPEQFEKVLLG